MAEILNTENFDSTVSEGVTFVDFFAEWCGPCKMVAPAIDEMSNEITDAKVVKVDVDQSPELAAKYGVRSIPTFHVFKDGEVVESIAGAKPKAMLVEMVSRALSL
jgi:thioredoxin 1